ncbi:hypothetical protein K439DRAFT_1657648 [Ramaria rubella]|nr:hypothetical protein K439DRAFT_1657648 [Ramaria rubella]
MTGSTPPAASSGNTSQHINPSSTANAQNPAPPTSALAPTTTGNISTTDLDQFSDDINAMRTRRNDNKAIKRLAKETTSDDEELLSDTNLFNNISSRNNPLLNIITQLPPPNSNPDPNISTSTHTTTSNLPNNTPPTSSNTPTTSPTTTSKPFAFAVDVTKKNKQLEMLETIPDQILTMVREQVYVPLSFFLADSLDRIRLDQDLKSHKSISRPGTIPTSLPQFRSLSGQSDGTWF